MKSKILLILPLALLALSIVPSVRAKPDLYAVLQVELRDIISVEFVPGGIRFDVSFEGDAGGPNIKEGTIEGVDRLFLNLSTGDVHKNVSLTITDKDGDKISANSIGLSVDGRSPTQKGSVDGWNTIINQTDYLTTGKYTDLIGFNFRTEDFISDFSIDIPGGDIHGYVHGKWYWP